MSVRTGNTHYARSRRRQSRPPRMVARLLALAAMLAGFARPVTAPCDASADPTNGKKGGCTSDLGNGKNCLYECDAGYTVSGLTKCNAAAELTKATCGASTCDATKTPQNGALGACADKAALASGAKCKPTCETGYELTPGDGHACLRGTVTEVRNNQCSVRCRVCALA